ncbi:MAG: Ppx/GppA family phosphatase [Rhodospirillales bacterium]|nr:Ppx/GppA family phosphatase [Rhodospirillales bacterium]
MSAEIYSLADKAGTQRLSSEKGAGRIAIVDIGSNTVRLVVYDSLSRLPVPVFNERVTCALGRGLGKSGRLNADGVKLAMSALTRFINLTEEMEVSRLELLATAAVREAEDGPAFAARVGKRFGRTVHVLSGDEEARLGATGVLSGVPDADGLVGDLGGGSLDLVSLDRGAFGESCSLPLGHLRIAEESEGDVIKTRNLVDAALDRLSWLTGFRGRRVYATGGAWRALARVSITQKDYPLHVIDGYSVPADAAIEMTRVLSGLGRKSLERITGLSRRRAETLPFAAMAMNRLLERARPERLVFSGYSMREGMLFEMLSDETRREDPLISACEGFAQRGGRFSVHGEEVVSWLEPLFPDASADDRRLCLAAALLSDIGWADHPDYRALHSFLRVLRLPIAGLTHGERGFLALAVFVRYDGSRRQYEVDQIRPLLTEDREHAAAVLGLALRLAHLISGGVPGLLEKTRLSLTESNLTLGLAPNRKLFHSEAVERLFRDLAKTLDVKPKIS